jgi:hypothetical protein
MLKPFNGLSGLELKQLILIEVKQAMSLDERFDSDQPVHGAFLVFTLNVEHKSAPADFVQRFTVTVSQKIPVPPTGLIPREIPARCLEAIDRNLSSDLRFATNVTYPFVTWNHRISVEGASRVEEPKTAVVPFVQPAVTKEIQAAIIGEDPAVVAARAEVERLKAELKAKTPDPMTALSQEIAELRKQLASVANGSAAADAESADLKRRQEQYERDTRDKLAWPPPDNSIRPRPSEAVADPHGNLMNITAKFDTLHDPEAAMRSSGSGAAVAIAVGHTPDGQIVGVTPRMLDRPDLFQVETNHPALANGGAGAPDALRREAGLTVPSPQRGNTGIVDLPAGSF